MANMQNSTNQFSDCPEVNSMIQEAYAYHIPIKYDFSKISICFGLKAKSSGKYYNYVRIGDDNKGKSGYVELLSFQYDSFDEAIEAIKSYEGIIESDYGFIKCDFTGISSPFSKTLFCKHYDITNINNSPYIWEYMRENSLIPKTTRVKTSAVKNAINGKNTFQCEDQFSEQSEVKIFKNGVLMEPKDYVLYKQGKVQFNETEIADNDTVQFEYNKFITSYKPYSNDLSNNISMFQDTHSGGCGSMYSFEPDPIGANRNVLLLYCDSLQEGAQNARQQFSHRIHQLTYFKDRIKMYIPLEMKEALISYPKAIDWFSIQGSWGQFGSQTGDTVKMYSGSANAFDIIKPSKDSEYLYFRLLCRRRHCDIIDGKEHYDVLTNEISSFPVKAGEWITIEREWKVGNPGICNHTIIDSDGKHKFNVQAYNSLCDPENEIHLYGNKYFGENPYNNYHPFICKLYTSSELAQYCIDKIGKCYLYFKDYELLEAENINAFN